MPVHIDRMVSEVTSEPEGSVPAHGGSLSPFEEMDRLRAGSARLTRDRARTAAEGFDD